MQSHEPLDVIGKPYPKKDARIKVTGECKFAADLTMPGILHGKLLRSPHAHARIVSIDTSKAEKLDGVRAVITGKDFPGNAHLLLPLDRTRWDPVQAVFAVHLQFARVDVSFNLF